MALSYNGVSYPTDPEPVAARLAEALSGDAWVLPIAIETDATSAVDRILELCATPGLEPDLMATLIGFRFGAGPTGGDTDHGAAALNRLDVPYLSPVLLTRTTTEGWLHHSSGLGPSEVLVLVMLPEFDGAIGQIPVATMTPPRYDARHRADIARPQVIDGQLNWLVGRVRGLLWLWGLANADKRIYLIGYDHPVGEGNLLAALQLDVAESIVTILVELHRMGYRTQPATATRLHADLMTGQVNSPAYLTEVQPLIYPYRQAQAGLGDRQAWDEVTRAWPADGPRPMVDSDGNYLVPRVEYGNMPVDVQLRYAPEVNDALIHDNTVPPYPQYLTYYTWLQHMWRADVIARVGIHGTLEFLKSRESVVSAHNFPGLMVGDIPHVYLYYTGNPAKALLVRCRSRATLVNYRPPVMTSGGLYDELEELVEALAVYRRSHAAALQSSGGQLANLRQRAEWAHLPTDPDQLGGELEWLRVQLTPLGLHVFGSHRDAGEMTYVVAGVIRNEVGDLALRYELIVVAGGLDVERIHRLNEAEIARYDEAVKRLMEMVSTSQTPATDLVGDETSQAVIVRAREPALWFVADQKWKFFHRALSGRHVETRLGGGAICNPKALSNGVSPYQLDSRQAPSALVARRRAGMAAQIVGIYRDGHDDARPPCVGLMLWGLETARAHGETYAQVMSLIGVRRAPSRCLGLPGWKVIPREELPGPWVDVVVMISGFFRDLFDALVEELDDMFAAVATFNEPDEINPIAARMR